MTRAMEVRRGDIIHEVRNRRAAPIRPPGTATAAPAIASSYADFARRRTTCVTHAPTDAVVKILRAWVAVK